MFAWAQDTGDYLPQLAPLAPALAAAARGQAPGGSKPAADTEGSGSNDACTAEAFSALDAYDSFVMRLSLPDQVLPDASNTIRYGCIT